MVESRYPVDVVGDAVYDERDGVALRADVYLPRGAARPCPVVVWLHGGGWRFGNRRVAPDLTRFYAERGLAMVAIDYRLSDRAIFPAQIQDVRTAIRWVRSIAPLHGFADRVGLWGASAGGHLAALAALCPPGVFEPAGSPHAAWSSAVQAVVAGYAPVDFLRLDADRPSADTVVADPENLSLPPGMLSRDADSFESLLLGAPIDTRPDLARAANPITYARPGAPPFLILHGASDTTVGARQSERLFDALARHDNVATLCAIEGLGHGFLNRSHLDDGAAWEMMVRTHDRGGERSERLRQPVFPAIEAFFRRHLAAATDDTQGLAS